MGRGMVLGEVVCQVAGAFLPVDAELALTHAVFDPVEAHVDGFGAALLDSVVGNAHCAFVVGDEWGRRLGPSHFAKRSLDGTGLLAIEEEATDFGFSCRGHDIVQDPANDMNGAVEGGVGGRRAVKEEEPAHAGASVGFG